MKKTAIILLAAGLIGFFTNTNAQLVNPGFETGDLTGWTVNGNGTASTGVTYNAWVVNPADNYMGYFQPSGSTPNLASAEAILGLAPGALATYNPGLFNGTTNFSVMHQDVALDAGETITMWWNFISTDYAPFNDACFSTFTGPATQEIHILSATTNAYGDPEAIIVGDYGSSGWYSRTYTAGAAGTYRIGFANFNLLDMILNPWNMIDNAPGGTSAPGDPIVTTSPVSDVNPPTAVCGGEVSDNGNTPAITVRGVCWNTTGSPTIADNFTTDGSGFGSFTSTLTGIVAGNTYYVRAYATNSNGTYYGGQVTFSAGPAATPISNWALILGAVAIALLIFIRTRKSIV